MTATLQRSRVALAALPLESFHDPLNSVRQVFPALHEPGGALH
jgi:hypothetical protein